MKKSKFNFKDPSRFLEIEPEYYDYKKSKFVVLPVPYETTTTYGKGTKKGPAAILRASQEVENFDEDLGYEPYTKAWIYTLKPSAVNRLPFTVSRILKEEKIPVVLGGEHSITPKAIKVFKNFYKDLSVLQLDAHADLRDIYEGSKNNHACAIRRVLEICPAVQAGIRSISQEEYGFAEKSGQLKKIHFLNPKSEIPGRAGLNPKQIPNSKFQIQNILGQLSKDIYLTIDVDVFDPSIIPSTGTPEPGGLFWYEALDILKDICRTKNVVGFDVVELAPISGLFAPDFTVAKLIYKLMGYISTNFQ